jgi:hypothetical protein
LYKIPVVHELPQIIKKETDKSDHEIKPSKKMLKQHSQISGIGMT